MRSRYTNSFIILIIFLFLISCDKNEEFITKTFFTENSYLSVTLPVAHEEMAEYSFENAKKYIENGKCEVTDKTIDFFKSKGINNFTIDFGGCIYVSGKKNSKYFAVGIKNPINTNNIISVIKVENKGIASYINDKGLYASISTVAKDSVSAGNLSFLYYGKEKNDIETECKKNKTPVLIVNFNGTIEKLCGWDKIDNE